MALTTTQIDSAITIILETGQAVTVDGVTYTRADLGQLQKLRETILSESAISSQGDLFSRGRIGAVRR